MKVRKIIAILLAAGIFLVGVFPINQVKADGMILPPDYYPVYSTQQKALIIYENGREELVISVSFNGKAEDFGWVVPFPNQPEISKVDSSIFRKLADITEPKQNLLDKIRGDGYYYPMGAMELAAPSKEVGEETTVVVLEEDSIGIFDYAVLEAGDPDDLKEWMEDNGYRLPTVGEETTELDYWEEDIELPQTQEEAWSDALPIFQDYIDSDWYFVTVKVSNKFTDSSGVESQLEEGAIDPLRFTFDTSDMIYPMKLTALGKRNISVMLYILDDHKVMVENYDRDYCSSGDEDCSYFTTQYAGKVKKNEIEELTKKIGKGSWYAPEGDMRITKLYTSSLSYELMDEEVLFKDTKNNQGVSDGTMSVGEWILLPFVLIIYLPYLILGGFLDVVSGGSYYYGYELGIAWFIGISAVLFVGSIIWIVISTILLKRSRKKMKRVLLYLLQFPAVWLVGMILSLIAVIPFGIVLGIIAGDEVVVFLDGFCCFSLLCTLLPLIFYRLLWKGKKRSK